MSHHSLVTLGCCTQGQFKGRASWTAAQGTNLQGVLKHHWKKSEIWIFKEYQFEGVPNY
jgi:hypothetical protein